ncbi:radial spoke head protein 9 homolog [Anomaloglossus baeobatrachus]|uniref:radial spoke head protein 9 homolog n=1 Tax=Anomaloglossus baeobatrachus TaxID=238106 RepID=UPI003F4F7586
MDAERLPVSVELVSGCGLSPEQSAALGTSLRLLRRDMRLSRAVLWGKILGVRGDYYIAQGAEESDQLRGRRTFYSLNCLDWCLLSPPTDDIIREAQLIKGRFIGDPAHEYELTVHRKAGEGTEVQEEDVTNHIKEETRLIGTIALIDREAAVAPRGAFTKTPLGQVHVNHSFRGLTVSEAKKLSSFFHFTPTLTPKKKSLLEAADQDPALDFLDSLQHDVPKARFAR